MMLHYYKTNLFGEFEMYGYPSQDPINVYSWEAAAQQAVIAADVKALQKAIDELSLTWYLKKNILPKLFKQKALINSLQADKAIRKFVGAVDTLTQKQMADGTRVYYLLEAMVLDSFGFLKSDKDRLYAESYACVHKLVEEFVCRYNPPITGELLTAEHEQNSFNN